MRKPNRRFFSAAALLLLSAFFLFLPLSGCQARYLGNAKQVMEKLDIAAQLNANGDMRVTETWRVNLKDRGRTYSNLYKTFPAAPDQNNKIQALSVYDVDDETEYEYREEIDPTTGSFVSSDGSFLSPNVCYTYYNSEDSEIEIGWFMPPIQSGVRTFRISYTVKDAVSVYADTSVLYHAFVGNRFSWPITQLNATLSLPAGAGQKEVQAWLHCTAQSRLSIDSPEKISFWAKEIPAETLVETRVAMPVSLFPSVTRKSGSNVLNGIRQEEQKWADDWAKKQQIEYWVGIADAASGVILTLLGIFLLVHIKRKYRRYRTDAPEYTREIPPGSSPGGAANLFYYYQGGVTGKLKGHVFSATLMSLAHKGCLRFERAETDGYSVSVTGNEKNTPLTESEQIFYEMLSTVASDLDGQFTMEQFRSYAEKHCKYIDRQMSRFLSATRKETASTGCYESRASALTASVVCGVFGMIFGFALLFLTKGWLVYLPLGLFLLGIFLLISGTGRTRLSRQGEHDLAVWNGLKKFMLEFSRMTEYGVPELALWEEYLVYATMMGISKKVCEQLKIVYPQLNDQAYLDTNFNTSFLYFMFWNRVGMGGGFGGGGDDFGTTLSSTISNISASATRLAHPPSSGNSGGPGGFGGFGGGGFGGGGFGGGGGGFGGGGGGGAR